MARARLVLKAAEIQGLVQLVRLARSIRMVNAGPRGHRDIW